MKRRCGSALVALALAAACGATAAGPARAQGSGVPDTVAPADTVIRLDPVTVRVLRWPLPVARVPIAVSAVEPEPRARTVRLGLGQVVRGVPGLQAENRYNPAQGDRIVVRGFGARAQFGVRGVRVLVDDVPATMPDGQSTLNHLDLGEVARAEVVRGPASMLYGNAAGGAVLIETVRPPSSGRSGEISAVAGTGGLLRTSAAAAAGAADGGWRLALTHERLDGFRSYSGSERWNATGGGRVAAAGGDLRLAAHLVHYDAQNPGGLTAEQFAADPDQAQERNVIQRTGEDGRHGQLGAVWSRSLGTTTIEASAHVLRRALDNPIPPAIIDLERNAAGGRVLLRSGPSDGLRWALGGETSGQWDDRLNIANESGERGARTLDQAETVSNVAAFGQLLLPLADRVHLFAAARWDRIRFAADDRLVADGNPDDSGERTMAAVSPAAGVSVRVFDGLTLFGSVSTSFQTPTTTELVNRPDGAGGFNPRLQPQRTLGVEAGARAQHRIRDVVLDAEVVAYRAAVRDALVPFEVPSSPGRSFFRNAAEALHTGLEASLGARRSGTEARAALTLTHAEFEEYAVGGTVYDGRLVPGIRPWTVEVLVGQDLPAGARITADWRATGAMHADDANTVAAEGEPLIAGYRRASVSLATPPLRVGRVSLEPYAGVENLFDARYSASVIVNAFGGRYFEPAPGRILFLGLRTRL